MSRYVNPGNVGFSRIVGPKYRDKTGLIAHMNERIRNGESLVCISRPRRFGKSYAAKMLTAYYDLSCDSHALFDDFDIAKTADYRTYLNQFNVIYLDVSGFVSTTQREGKSLRDVPGEIITAIRRELEPLASDLPADASLEEAMIRCTEEPEGRAFIFIIDEWDALIREAKDDAEAQKRYLNLLRGWFKNDNFTPKAVAAAYMTGILPIKKDGSQSAISDFREYTMLHPGRFAPYTGFTEDEVASLCAENDMPFETVKTWYDGYALPGAPAIYNPYSVMYAMDEGECRSFWGRTSAAEGLTDYIQMDFDGLQETVAKLITGSEVEVNPDGFQNDFSRFDTKDDVLTLLIHLGYLTYDGKRRTAHIPKNIEGQLAFQKFLGEDQVEKYRYLIERDSE